VKLPSLFSIVLLVVCGAAAAEAQTQPPQSQPQPGTGSRRPYKALFGGAATDPSKHHTLDLTASVGEGYDTNVLAEGGDLGVGAGTAAEQSGFVSTFNPTVEYAWTGRSVQFTGAAGSSLRYYQTAHELLPSTHFGTVGLSIGGQRTLFTTSQSVSYSPSYLYSIFPTLGTADVDYVVAATGDYAANWQQVLVYDTTMNLNQSLSQRSHVTALGSFRYSDLSNLKPGRALRAYTAGGRYFYDLSRNASLHLGYIHREGNYVLSDLDRATVVHDIDVGVDYHRPLSFSRRTHVDFGVGSSIVNAPTIDSGNAQLQYRVGANAGLTHDIGRTWRARVEYRRGVGFVEAVRQPVFSDAVNGSFSGFFTRRTDLYVSGGFSTGDAGTVSVSQNRVRTYTGSARLRTALNQTFALFAEYVYYNYDLGSAVIVADGVPRSLDRNTARVGVSVWVPVLRK
jgi:hypothetical protein